MKLFIVALLHEAQILIDTFSLRCIEKSPYSVYQNASITVVISGVGTIHAAGATAFALSRYANTDKIINYGTCAAHPDMTEAYGKLYLIEKIIDHCTHRVYHLPSRNLSLPSATLYTFAQPLDNPKNRKVALADMEGSAFYQTAIRFVPKEHVIVLKVVTDWMEEKIPLREELTHIQQQHIPLLAQL